MNFLSYFFTFKTAWVISKPRWRMDGRWDRIFITFNDLADSTADTHRVLMTRDTCRVAWACCIVTHVPRATCMQTRILRPLLCKISVGRRRGKKSPRKVFRSLFRVAYIHLRARRLFVPSLKSARTIEFDEMFTYLCREAPFALSFECRKH